MEDPEKIKSKLKELGEGWVEANGYHALTSVEYSKQNPNGSTFNPARGIPLKVFVNPSSGEIKSFLADSFEKDV